ncbi:MAG: hypothetical protein ACKVTZ_22475 [Bacteroidia bacterium]
MEKTLIDLMGWVGMAMVVFAYGANIQNKLPNTSLAYILLNMIGSIFLIINCFYNHAMPPAILNIIWTIIAFYSLWQYFRREK